jgi:hypothetical protein
LKKFVRFKLRKKQLKKPLLLNSVGLQQNKLPRYSVSVTLVQVTLQLELKLQQVLRLLVALV